MSIGTYWPKIPRSTPDFFSALERSTLNHNGVTAGTGTAHKTAYAPVDRRTLQGRDQDARVFAQLDELLCRLEARMRGLKQLEGPPPSALQMKRAGFPGASDIAWVLGKFAEANRFMNANPGKTGTFVDFDALWTVNREKNTLTVSLPNGVDGPPVVSFPLASFVRYLQKSR